MEDEEQQINARYQYNHIEPMEERKIVDIIEPFLQNHNQLVQLFNTFSNTMKTTNYTIVIKADKVPCGQHADRYNAPTIMKLQLLLVDDPFERRDAEIY